jgi:hypothetical protein
MNDLHESRLRALERSHRRLGRLAALMLIVAGGLLVMGQSGNATREGRYQLLEYGNSQAVMWDTATGEVREYDLRNVDHVSLERAFAW